MPYTYKKQNDKYCVYKKDTGKKVGCTDGNKTALKRYMTALRMHSENIKLTSLLPKVNEGQEETENYMFFSNLEQMRRQIDILLQIDPQVIEMIIQNGHNWAEDHITVAKEDLDQVFDFLMNELNKGK